MLLKLLLELSTELWYLTVTSVPDFIYFVCPLKFKISQFSFTLLPKFIDLCIFLFDQLTNFFLKSSFFLLIHLPLPQYLSCQFFVLLSLINNLIFELPDLQLKSLGLALLFLLDMGYFQIGSLFSLFPCSSHLDLPHLVWIIEFLL